MYLVVRVGKAEERQGILSRSILDREGYNLLAPPKGLMHGD